MISLLLMIAVISILLSFSHNVSTTTILSKSKLEKCEKFSASDALNCTSKIVLNLSVPSESSGREASIVAEIVEAEENATNHMRTLRIPPVITVNKTSAYALYELTYIRDVAYKPQEFFVQTRKCEPDAGSHVVGICERLRDADGHIMEQTQPICCPCGDQRRVPSSCGNFFDKMMKGKANTAHCLRFADNWFHVFGIGKRSVGFSIRIEVKAGSKISEVTVGPENRTAISGDNFLRVNLVGDYVGYTDIPSFDDFYLVTPRQGVGPGGQQPQDLGSNYSMWMLLERVRFTLDGLECNKIGVGYETYNSQADFCSSPFWSCLHNQLWNFWDADQNRISRNLVPLYCVQGRFERINQHPNAGSHAFSIGITEVINTNLLVELSADDIEYVYQRSPGKILGITVPTFEALTQYGTATIITKNIGEVEASYSLTFDCSTSISQMEEQFYIMKPNEVFNRSFKLYPTSDQAARYACSAILKDADFKEVDRAECQFTTTATIVDNGSQIPFQPPKTSINGFFESIEDLWNRVWAALAEFITGKNCRKNCHGFFDFSCHIQYICMSWMLMFGLFLAIFPTVIVLIWLLHQKGLFDPIYDWWEDHMWTCEEETKHKDKWKHNDKYSEGSFVHFTRNHHKHNDNRHHRHHHHKHDARKTQHSHIKKMITGESDYDYYLHRVHKDKHKNHHHHHHHARIKSSGVARKVVRFGEEGDDDERDRHHVRRKESDSRSNW